MGKQLIATISVLFFIMNISCSPITSASSEMSEWYTVYRYELEEIPLSEVSDSYIQSVFISNEAANHKNILAYDVSFDGSIIVTLKEHTIHVYNSDLSLRYRVDTAYNATIIGFWQEDRAIIKFDRGNTALGLDENGSIVSAYHVDDSINNAMADAQLSDERIKVIGDYTYCFQKRSMLTRIDSQNKEEIIYKNEHTIRNALLFTLIIVLFLSVMAIIVVVKVVLPMKREYRNR